MRQRNDTGYPLLVAADPPFSVEAGETVDHHEPVAGLTVLEDESAPAERPRRRGRQQDDPAEADAAGDDTPGGQL
jgi:hypothetical protein